MGKECVLPKPREPKPREPRQRKSRRRSNSERTVRSVGGPTAVDAAGSSSQGPGPAYATSMASEGSVPPTSTTLLAHRRGSDIQTPGDGGDDDRHARKRKTTIEGGHGEPVVPSDEKRRKETHDERASEKAVSPTDAVPPALVLPSFEVAFPGVDDGLSSPCVRQDRARLGDREPTPTEPPIPTASLSASQSAENPPPTVVPPPVTGYATAARGKLSIAALCNPAEPVAAPLSPFVSPAPPQHGHNTRQAKRTGADAFTPPLFYDPKPRALSEGQDPADGYRFLTYPDEESGRGRKKSRFDEDHARTTGPRPRDVDVGTRRMRLSDQDVIGQGRLTVEQGETWFQEFISAFKTRIPWGETVCRLACPARDVGLMSM